MRQFKARFEMHGLTYKNIKMFLVTHHVCEGKQWYSLLFVPVGTVQVLDLQFRSS